MRERNIEQHLHARVKQLGGEHRRLSYQGRSGATDDLILLLAHGKHAVVECKKPGEKAKSHQEREHVRLAQAGFFVRVVSTIEEVDAALDELVNGE